MSKNKVSNNQFLRFSEREDYLRIFINSNGRTYVKYLRTNYPNLSEADILLSLIEYHYGTILPQDVGDLRSEWDITISNMYQWVDQQLIVGTAYTVHNTTYSLYGYIKPLLKQGYIDLKKHNYHSVEEFERLTKD